MATSTDVGNPTPMATPTMNEHRVENSQPNQGRTPLSSYSPAAQRVGLAPLPPIKSITMWQGTLTWVEMSTVGKEVEMSTYVMAGTAHHQYTFVETWPQTMRIVPTNEPVAAMADIHLWLQRHRPAFCTFRAQPRAVSDPVLNQQNFKTLVRLLGMKNVYATAAWTLPSGQLRNVAVFFLINTSELAGVFFPITGLPELPRARPSADIRQVPGQPQAPPQPQGQPLASSQPQSQTLPQPHSQIPPQSHPPTQPQGQVQTLSPTSQSQPQPQPQPQTTAPRTQPTFIWQGSISWILDDTTGRKEMTTYVAANTGTPRESAAETWPQNMTLMLTNEPIVSMVDLQAWMRRSKPLLCQFTLPPPPDIQDATSNTHSYQKLFQYVTSKPFYTVAAWTLPSGKHCNNVIFVALNKIGLIGAFFPRTGIPEMPKPLPPGSSQVDISTRTPPMTPEQREAVLTQIKRRWDFQLQQFRFLKMRLHTARGKQQQHVTTLA